MTPYYNSESIRATRELRTVNYRRKVVPLAKVWREKKAKLFRLLREVRDDLRAGKLIHRRPSRAQSTFKNMFNMLCWGDKVGCGTVYCIGGWLNHKVREGEADRGIGLLVRSDPALSELFHPRVSEWGQITPAQAADAIQRFLNGEEPW